MKLIDGCRFHSRVMVYFFPTKNISSRVDFPYENNLKQCYVEKWNYNQSQNIVVQPLFPLKNMLTASHPLYSMLRECGNCLFVELLWWLPGTSGRPKTCQHWNWGNGVCATIFMGDCLKVKNHFDRDLP